MADAREYIEKDYMLKKTDFDLPGLYKGKVRDNYTLPGNRRLIITSDRLSAFDRVITTIPFKGQILNEITVFWLELTGKEVPNHFISSPDPNVMIVKECKPIPIEMVVRKYITGSAWRAYEENPEKPLSGVLFPKGLKKNQELVAPVITPTTKETDGHDAPISKAEIIERGIVDEETYEKMERMAIKLFVIGTQVAADNGLILVDTKYEFGIDADGNLVVIDEIHTPDSSRFWYKSTYDELFEKGDEQKALDKEFVREWLRDVKKFTGEGVVPEVDVAVKIELSNRYITNYELVTGKKFVPAPIEPGMTVVDRIMKNLKSAGIV